jgi:signal transduction histidine kinase
MSIASVATGDLVFVAYVLVFALAALICFGSLTRARTITHSDTRRGLVALLVTSGAWAAAHVGFLVVPTPGLKLAFYYVGLIVGISTVGPWLYFCSAFTGRTLHRSRVLQRLAIGVFLAIVAVKLTNPIHGLYFRAELVTTPFPHLAVQHLLLHWIAMGLAYALATIGYFMLFELFWQVGHDSKPFVGLVGLTGLPIVLDIIGLASPRLLDFTYEPLGVAAFAVGVLFVYLDELEAIQLAGEHDEPVVVLDDDNRVRDYNREARELFPTLEIDEVIDAIIPEIRTSLDADEPIIKINRVGGMKYFQVSSHPFTSDQRRLGQAITLTDVTDREQYRTELERQNERLEQFASMVSHDLRNPLTVAQGRIELALEDPDPNPEDLTAASTALERMEALIDDLLALARQGQPISETEDVRLSTIVEQCWDVVDTREAILRVDEDLYFKADPDRLQQLLENLFRNAVDHGGDDVEIRVGALDGRAGFHVTDDGPGIPEDDRENVFESGYSTDDDGTGFGLAIVSEIVDAHGWTIRVTDAETGGARFEVTGVDLAE